MTSTKPATLDLWRSFSRSQVSSFVATLADWTLIFILAEAFHVWYVAATAIGAGVGALSNFLLNRYWSFGATGGHWCGQALRYGMVSTGSLLLNSGGVYLVTEGLRVHYSLSVVAVSFFVGIGFNFPMQRFFVFSLKRQISLK